MSTLFSDRERREFSLDRWFGQLAAGDDRGSSLEREMLEESARVAGETFVPGDSRIPWELISARALTAGGSGAQLVSEKLGTAQFALRDSLTARLGVPIVDIPAGSWRLPIFPQPTDCQWLEDENSGVEVEQPTIGAARVSPRTMASLASYSKDWARDSLAGPQSVETWLLSMVARTLDKALLTGKGVDGEPLGLLNVPGTQVGTVDGTACFDDLCAIDEALEAAESANHAWILSPAGKRLLRGRIKTPSGLPILEGAVGSPVLSRDHVDGTPAIATTACPDGRILSGDWSSATVYSWGSPKIAVKQHGSTLFRSGLIQMRILLECDILFARPERFAVAALS